MELRAEGSTRRCCFSAWVECVEVEEVARNKTVSISESG